MFKIKKHNIRDLKLKKDNTNRMLVKNRTGVFDGLVTTDSLHKRLGINDRLTEDVGLTMMG